MPITIQSFIDEIPNHISAPIVPQHMSKLRNPHVSMYEEQAVEIPWRSCEHYPIVMLKLHAARIAVVELQNAIEKVTGEKDEIHLFAKPKYNFCAPKLTSAISPVCSAKPSEFLLRIHL